MSALSLTFTSQALRGELDALRSSAKAELATRAEPLPFATAALIVISGNDLEIDGYRSLSAYEASLAWSFFCAGVTSVAKQLLQVHPAVAEEVLAHKFIKEHLTTGPFKRLPRNLQAIKALSGLFADAWFFMEYQQRGLFDWDDGDAQGTIAIVYLWRKVVQGKRGIFQSSGQLHKEGRQILASVCAAHPQNTHLRLIDHRAKLAWFTRTPDERATSMAVLDDLSRQPGQIEDTMAIRLLALSFLFDADLRFRVPERALTVLTDIQSIVVPNQPDHPQIVLGRAWAKALGGDQATARQAALESATKGDEIMRSKAARILQIIGDTQTADTILNGLGSDFRPREKRLGSVPGI
jgi:hypothetical protein